MEGQIETLYKMTITFSESELHDLLLDLISIISNDHQDGFEQYPDIHKLHDKIQSWLKRMTEMKLL